MKHDYSYSCECGGDEGGFPTHLKATRAATLHARSDPRCGVKNPTVFIDQYSLGDSELSGAYTKMQIATPSKK